MLTSLQILTIYSSKEDYYEVNKTILNKFLSILSEIMLKIENQAIQT